MSTTIDQRIVEMQFNNQQFEANAQRSINTLSKLKQSLDFVGAAKGLLNLGNAAKSVDFQGISTAVDSISSKFSALSIAGITTIQRLTNAAITMGSRMAKALTITPILSGFREYETQINATQTILSNTTKEGATIKDVNAALDELNKYADLTIYNFTEMTKNIGTFTAAGVKLETSVNAIQGIANLAAVSGSTSQQASTAMYQLSQALAAGTVKLMDWNSVVNAGMGGQKFQDALMMTAKVHGIAIDEMIKKNGSFRETLQNGWLTADILTETLQHFTEFTDEYNEKTLKAQGYTAEQIKQIKEMGIDATNAATKVKTFTQLWDVLQEAAQSGWAQTWRLIVGDFEQAKTTLTEFSDILTEVINNASAKRNALLTSGLTSGFNQFITEAGIDFETFSTQVQKTAKDHGIAIDDMIKEDGSFEESLHRGWMTADVLKESLNETTKSLSGMSDEELKAKDYTKEQVEALKEYNVQVQNGSVNVEEWAKKMGLMSGRENLMESLLNVFKAIVAIAKPVKEAFDQIFPAMSGDQLYGITEKIRKFTESLIVSKETAASIKNVFLGVFSAIKPFIEAGKTLISIAFAIAKAILPLGSGLISLTGHLGKFVHEALSSFEASKALKNGLDGLRTVFSWLEEKMGVLAEKIGPTLMKVLKGLGSIIGDVLGRLGEAFNKGDFSQIFAFINGGLLASLIVNLKKGLGGLFEDLSSLPKLGNGLKGILDDVRGALTSWQTDLKASTIEKLAISVAVLAAALVAMALVDPINLTAAIGAMAVLFKMLNLSMDSLAASFDAKKLGKLGAVSAVILSMGIAINVLAHAVRLMSGISWADLAKGLIGVGVLLAAMTKTTNALTSNKAKLFKGAAGIIAFALAIRILASAVKVLGSLDLASLAKGLAGAVVMIVAMVKASDAMSGSKGIMVNALGLIAMATALKIMASAVSSLGGLDLQSLAKGLGATLIMLTAMVVAANALGKNAALMPIAAAGLVAMAIGLRVIAGAITVLGSLSWEELVRGLVGIAGAVGILVAAMVLIPASAIITSAAALVVASAAFMAIGTAMTIVGALSWGEIAKGLVALAGAFTILGLAGLVLAPIVPIILALSAALALAGVGVLALGVGITALAVGFGSLGVSIATFSASIAASAAAIVAALKTVIIGILELIPDVVKAIGEGIVKFAKVIIKSAPTIAEAIVTVIDETLKAIANHAESIVTSLLNILKAIFKALFKFIKENGPEFVSEAKALGKKFIKGLGKGLVKIGDVAADAIEGFVKGIKIGNWKVGESAWNLGSKFLKGLKKVLGIKSPSKKAMEIAEYVVEGFSLGIAQNLDDVSEASEQLGEACTKSITKALGTLFDTMTYGRKATAMFINEFSSLSDLADRSKLADSFTTARNAITDYAKKLYLASDAYEENTQKVKELEKEQKSLEKQIDKLSKQSDETVKSNLKSLREDLKETKKELKTARKEITENTTQFVKNQKAAYNELQNSIASSLGSSLDPLSMSLETQIDLLKKFEETTDEVTKADLIENMKSQVEGISKWNEKLEALAEKGFAAGILEDLKELGPTATNYIKAFEEMTAEEMAQANAYFKQSSEMTVSTFLKNWTDAEKAVQTWSENLVTLAKRGVSQGFIEAVAQAGMPTESLVTALMTATDEQLAELNTHYESLSSNKNSAAQRAMMAIAASGAGMGAELANALKAQIAPESEAVTAVTEAAKATGEQTATATATGIAESATSTANTTKVTKAGETLGTAAYNGVKSKINTSTGKTLGLQLCNGLVEGLKSGSSNVTTAAKSVAAAALAAAEAELGVESPSKEFMKIGYFADLGLANGLKKYAFKVKDGAEEVGQVSLKGIKNALSSIASVVDSDIVGMSPTIRPVIDLDDLRSGIDSMNRMMPNRAINVNAIRAKTMGISSGITEKITNSTTQPGNRQNGNSFSFVQNNYSPKALSQIEIYRQTKNQFSAMKGALQGV